MKPLKLFASIFVGLDIFIVGYFALSQARFALFGQGQIPGGGSALDMALFLIPLFIGYVAGDRLYHFLTYKERKAALAQAHSLAAVKETAPVEEAAAPADSVWEDGSWEEEQPAKTGKGVA